MNLKHVNLKQNILKKNDTLENKWEFHVLFSPYLSRDFNNNNHYIPIIIREWKDFFFSNINYVLGSNSKNIIYDNKKF